MSSTRPEFQLNFIFNIKATVCFIWFIIYRLALKALTDAERHDHKEPHFKTVKDL